MEPFHVSLKKKEIYTTACSDFEQANQALFKYVEVFYNLHRSLKFWKRLKRIECLH
ncbi:IS3 family transposase [Vagococcus elongatus]|uniref:IS3 family transposase n=1 Tax=Vagococcus elongatus TaxID=180344 RepID=UPI003CCC777B